MADDKRSLPVSLVLETNHGGQAVTICACGVLLYHGDSAWFHIDNCPTAQEFFSKEARRG